MTYYIYKATDKTNHKSYIGCTKNFGSRIRQHINSRGKDNVTFHQAIKEHGITSFTWEIIDTAQYADDAYNLEKYYIKVFNTFHPNGYNATTGGIGSEGYTGKKVVCLDLEGNYIKTYVSANSTEKDGYNPGEVLKICKGIRLSSKHRQFMFEEDYLKNGPTPYKRPPTWNERCVVQCDMDGNMINKYKSLSDASEQTGTLRPSISACLRGRYKSANGFIWVYENDYPIKDISRYKHGSKGIKVAQLDVETEEIIAVFDSVTDAGRAIGKNYRNIQKILDVPGRTAYGYKWKRI